MSTKSKPTNPSQKLPTFWVKKAPVKYRPFLFVVWWLPWQRRCRNATVVQYNQTAFWIEIQSVLKNTCTWTGLSECLLSPMFFENISKRKVWLKNIKLWQRNQQERSDLARKSLVTFSTFSVVGELFEIWNSVWTKTIYILDSTERRLVKSVPFIEFFKIHKDTHSSLPILFWKNDSTSFHTNCKVKFKSFKFLKYIIQKTGVHSHFRKIYRRYWNYW